VFDPGFSSFVTINDIVLLTVWNTSWISTQMLMFQDVKTQDCHVILMTKYSKLNMKQEQDVQSFSLHFSETIVFSKLVFGYLKCIG